MNKKNTVCWNCGKAAMEPDLEFRHGWLKCSNCGATHYPNGAKLTASPIVVELVTNHYPETKYRPRKRRLPRTEAR